MYSFIRYSGFVKNRQIKATAYLMFNVGVADFVLTFVK